MIWLLIIPTVLISIFTLVIIGIVLSAIILFILCEVIYDLSRIIDDNEEEKNV